MSSSQSATSPMTLVYHVYTEPCKSRQVRSFLSMKRNTPDHLVLRSKSSLFRGRFTEKDIENHGNKVQSRFHELVDTGIRMNEYATVQEYVDSRVDLLKSILSFGNYEFRSTDDPSVIPALEKFKKIILSLNMIKTLVVDNRRSHLRRFAEAYMTKKEGSGNNQVDLADELQKTWIGCGVYSMNSKCMEELTKYGILENYVPPSINDLHTMDKISQSDTKVSESEDTAIRGEYQKLGNRDTNTMSGLADADGDNWDEDAVFEEIDLTFA
ncbi:uncharacterized protein L199_007006 [Kwoniella botswanensis]|uniref:uncharacterized protein n=1 Tax=Kwoniella botswanensis TaxID=1268659 RepID=UPI00315DB6A8